MKAALLSRLITFGLICAIAGYVVVASTTPASTAAATRAQYAHATIQSPLATIPAPQHTVEVNLPPIETAQPLNFDELEDDEATNALPHGPHDDILAIFAKPDIEVDRPRSPFLEQLPRVYEPEPVAKPAVKQTKRESSSTATKRTKGRRIAASNPFAGLFQPKFRSFNGDNPFRQTNQGLFGPRKTNRRTGRSY